MLQPTNLKWQQKVGEERRARARVAGMDFDARNAKLEADKLACAAEETRVEALKARLKSLTGHQAAAGKPGSTDASVQQHRTVTVAKEASPLMGGSGGGSIGTLFTMLCPALLGTAVEFYDYTCYVMLTQEIVHNFFSGGMD